MANRLIVLSGYKRLLNSATRAFRNDTDALYKARVEIRHNFENNKHETDPIALKEMIHGIDDVIDFLETNIIQAQLKDDDSGDYELKFSDEQAAALSQEKPNELHIMKENELPEIPQPCSTTSSNRNKKEEGD